MVSLCAGSNDEHRQKDGRGIKGNNVERCADDLILGKAHAVEVLWSEAEQPYPGIVWEHEGETRNPLSADSSQVIHAAKLFVISLENPLIAKDISGTQNHKLAELTRFESRGNKALYRIGMYFEDARKLKTLYSWVMVTENSDGSYETPPEGHFMGDFVALCGIDPSGFDIAQARKRIRDANGWTD